MPTAPADGVVEVDGNPYLIRAGDEYPEGGTLRQADYPNGGEVEPPAQNGGGTRTTKSTSSS